MKCKPCQRAKIEEIIARIEVLSKNDLDTIQLNATEHYRENGVLYLKTFLINDLRNNNGWRASWNSIKNNVKSFIGTPGIEYYKCGEYGCMRDHTDAKSLEENVKIQERYRVSTIVDVMLDEPTHTAYAIHRIENKDFEKKIEKNKIKYLSPSIWPNRERTTININEDDEWYIDTTDWKGVHDAWVDNPAFGHAARIIGRCFGGEECITKLKGDTLLVAKSRLDKNKLLTARVLTETVKIRHAILYP